MLNFDPAVMAALLPALAELDDWQPVGHTVSISLARVQAVAWNPGRLARCAARLAAGERAPAIHVSRYWLHGEAYYTLSDGNHRAIAARQAGHKRIRATIGGENWCKPEKYFLDTERASLWRSVVHKIYGPVITQVLWDIEPGVQQALLSVGVNRLNRERGV